MEMTLQTNGTSKDSDPCLWMQAGIVTRKLCDTDYQCSACKFDRMMKKAARDNELLREQKGIVKGERQKIVLWQDRLRELPASKRPCLHHIKRRIDFRACTNDYHCSDCEFDQYFQDQYTVYAVVKPVDVLDIDGIRFPQGYYLHKGHTWAKIEEGSMIRVGLDDFAFRVFGTPDHIEAPLVGKMVKQNQGDIQLKRGHNRAAILSPVSGVVTDVNPRFREIEGRTSDDPYSDGWIMRVHSNTLRQDLKSLCLGDETAEMLKQDVRRLYDVIEETAGPLAVDGGQIAHDIFGAMPEIGWDRLTQMFLSNNK